MFKGDKQKESKAFAGISIDSQDQNVDIYNTSVSKLNAHESPYSSPREKTTFGWDSSRQPPRSSGRGRHF